MILFIVSPLLEIIDTEQAPKSLAAPRLDVYYLPDARSRFLQNLLHPLDYLRGLGNCRVDLLLKLLAAEISRPIPVKELLGLGGKLSVLEQFSRSSLVIFVAVP